jgi:hypothetical protein
VSGPPIEAERLPTASREVGACSVRILGPDLLAAGLWPRRATPVWVPVAPLLSVAVASPRHIPVANLEPGRCRMHRDAGGRAARGVLEVR